MYTYLLSSQCVEPGTSTVRAHFKKPMIRSEIIALDMLQPQLGCFKY